MVRSYFSINVFFVVLLIVVLSLTWVRRADAEMTEGEAGGLSCATCGNECAVLCSNRQSRLFRSCCMNFMRKRRSEKTLNSNSNSNSEASSDFVFPPSFYRF